jgi:2-oxoglutarate-Fe(II)-dependent oxygenase superfamily protein
VVRVPKGPDPGVVFAVHHGVGLADDVRAACREMTPVVYPAAGWYTCSSGTGTGREDRLQELIKAYAPEPEATQLVFHAYRDGSIGTGWHDDRNVSASAAILSVGATRTFGIRPYRVFGAEPVEDHVLTVVLPHDSLVLLSPEFHAAYQHTVCLDPGITEERWSLVFRTLSQ